MEHPDNSPQFGFISNCDCENPNDNTCDLLPDLIPVVDILSTSREEIVIDESTGNEINVLRYPYKFANIGSGPLELRVGNSFFCDGIEATDPDNQLTNPGTGLICNNGGLPTVEAVQTIYGKINGNTQTSRDESVGILKYDDALGHSHYHFQDLGTATLRISNGNPSVSDWPIAVETTKQHFNIQDTGECEEDEDNCCNIANCNNPDFSNNNNNGGFGGKIPSTEADNTTDGKYTGSSPFLPAGPSYPISNYSGNLFGGLSVGSSDLYDTHFAHQWIDLGLYTCNGNYELVLEVNHNNALFEENINNNIAHLSIQLSNQLELGTTVAPINSNTIWDLTNTALLDNYGYTRFVAGTVTVKNEKSLTIKDIDVRFAENARIVVEKGAKLIIDGATLTTVCDQIFWEGIQVHGDRSKPHPASVTEGGTNPPDHGVVFFKNDASIRNASNAVKTMKVDNYGTPNQSPDHSNRNGIVVIDDAEFYNNICSVVLFGGEATDDSPTASKVENARFIIDDAFHSANFTHNPNPLSGTFNNDPDFQVYLTDIVSLILDNLTFDNQATSISGETAFKSNNSYFNLQNSTVSNFKMGIEAIQSVGAEQKNQVRIFNNQFFDNDKSILLSGFTKNGDNYEGYDDNDTDLDIHIDFNKFSSDNLIDSEGYSTYGIYLNGCTDYIISDSEFLSGESFGECLIVAYSVIDDNDNGPTNYIQNNKLLSESYAGIIPFSDNPTLQLHCNTFSNQLQTGIYLTDDQGIAFTQGSCIDITTGEIPNPDFPEDYPTGNTLATGNGHAQFDNNSVQFEYYYYPDEGPELEYLNWSGVEFIECNSGIMKNCNFTNGTKVDTDTGSPCCSCQRVDEMLNDILELNKYIEQDKTLLTDYYREDESTSIEAATDISKIKNITEGFELYLSNSELKAVALKLGKLPPVDVLNVLIENGPVQQEVKIALEDHLNTLPVLAKNFLTNQYSKQLDQILAQTNGLSLRAEKKSDIVRNLRAQTETLEPMDGNNDGDNPICGRGTDIKQYMLQALQKMSKSTVENSLWFKKQEIDFLVRTKEYQQANETLKLLQTNMEESIADYVLLKQLEIRLKQEGRSVKDLKKEEIQQLEAIQNNNSIEGILARNTLVINKEGSLGLNAPPIPDKKLKEVVPEIEGFHLTKALDIWPNPSNNEVNINLGATFNVSSQFSIQLFNLAGKQLKEIQAQYQSKLKISIDDIEEGSYILSVTNINTGEQKKAKILIIR